jgi:hypothetical protein
MNYENNNKVLVAEYPSPQFPSIPAGGLYEIKCKNYVLCEETFPDWWYDCKGQYLCTNCDIAFGTWTSGDTVKTGSGILKTTENVYCPVCFETKLGISYPNCSHTACIDCMKRFFYGECINEPAFPYPEIEDEYYDEDDDDVRRQLKTDYPLIKPHLEECRVWEEDAARVYENEEYLRKCPICRA